MMDFKSKAIIIHENRYDYSKSVYISAKIKIEIVCKEHGSFFQRPDVHLIGRGCPKCGTEKRISAIRSNKQEFIDKANIVHEFKYNYSQVNYLNAHTKVSIICPEHGDFLQKPNNHLTGYGCRKCANEILSLDTYSFIQKSMKIHKKYYNYSRVKYLNSKSKVEIICPKHGVFFQNADNHIYARQGCQKCGRDKTADALKLTKGEFIAKARTIHGNFYNYSNVEYENSGSKVDIICPMHGMFNQNAGQHLLGAGCRQCGKYKSQDLWLDSCGLPNDHKHRQVRLPLNNNRFIVADGYDPLTNTVYEYWGTYFHGHPDYYNSENISFMGATFGDLNKKTLEKIEAIKASGYNIIEQWAHHKKDGTVILIGNKQ